MLKISAFKQSRTIFGKDIAGGGVELTCPDMMHTKHHHNNEVVELFKEKLCREDMKKYCCSPKNWTRTTTIHS